MGDNYTYIHMYITFYAHIEYRIEMFGQFCASSGTSEKKGSLVHRSTFYVCSSEEKHNYRHHESRHITTKADQIFHFSYLPLI